VIAGTDYHRWHCIDGTGEIRWSYGPRTGPRANSAAAGDIDGDGLKEVIFAGADTHVHVLKADGDLVSQFNTGDEVTQVIAVDMDGDGLDEIVASSMSFNVYVIKGDGKTILWRTDLGEVVTGIAVGDFNGDGKLEVAAGVADGFVHLLSNEDGKVLSRY
jgi:outer membrane protein assembly factor BamB